MRGQLIGYGVGTGAAVVALCFGGYYAYWGTRGNNHHHHDQSSLISQERNRVDAYDHLTPTIAAEKDAIARQSDRVQQIHIGQEFCQIYGDITDAPLDLSLAHHRICH